MKEMRLLYIYKKKTKKERRDEKANEKGMVKGWEIEAMCGGVSFYKLLFI